MSQVVRIYTALKNLANSANNYNDYALTQCVKYAEEWATLEGLTINNAQKTRLEALAQTLQAIRLLYDDSESLALTQWERIAEACTLLYRKFFIESKEQITQEERSAYYLEQISTILIPSELIQFAWTEKTDTHFIDTARPVKHNIKMVNAPAVKFNGVDQYINCGNDASLRLTNNFAIGFMTNEVIATSGHIINTYGVSGSRSYYLRLTQTSIQFVCSTDGFNISKNYLYSINLVSESKVFLSFIDGIIELYVNDILQEALKLADLDVTSVYETVNNLYIGYDGFSSYIGTGLAYLYIKNLSTGQYAGYWPLQETAGDIVYDVSGNGNNGTLNGNKLNVTTFDGIANNVNVPNNVVYNRLGTLNNAQGFTVEGWIKGTDTEGMLFSNLYNETSIGTGGFSLAVKNSRLQARIKANSGSGQRWSTLEYGTGNLSDGQWHHVAMVFNTTHQYFYIDGQFVGDFNQSYVNDPWTSTGALKFAIPANAGISAPTTQPYTGAISDVRVWDVARSNAQIDADKMNSVLIDDTGLKGRWRMTEGTGTTVFDTSVTANNGTFLGTWVLSTVPCTDCFVYEMRNAKQSCCFYNEINGYTQYGLYKIPALIDGSGNDAQGNPLANPAVGSDFIGGCELDFTNGNEDPTWLADIWKDAGETIPYSLPTTYKLGDTFDSPTSHFKKTFDGDKRENYFMLYKHGLDSEQFDKVNNYLENQSIFSENDVTYLAETVTHNNEPVTF